MNKLAKTPVHACNAQCFGAGVHGAVSARRVGRDAVQSHSAAFHVQLEEDVGDRRLKRVQEARNSKKSKK